MVIVYFKIWLLITVLPSLSGRRYRVRTSRGTYYSRSSSSDSYSDVWIYIVIAILILVLISCLVKFCCNKRRDKPEKSPVYITEYERNQ